MKNNLIDVEKDHQILQNIDLIKQSWRFIPKHLLVIKNQQKNGIQGGVLRKLRDKDALYQQSTLQTINKNKNYYLSPIRDIQKIMKHFHTKFQPLNNISKHEQYKGSKKGKHKKQQSKKRRVHTVMQLKGQNGEQLIENKITRLLQLPTIKRANSQAQRLKSVSIMKSAKKQEQKNQILRRFQEYFNKQINILDHNKSINTLKSTLNKQSSVRKQQRKKMHTTIDTYS